MENTAETKTTKTGSKAKTKANIVAFLEKLDPAHTMLSTAQAAVYTGFSEDYFKCGRCTGISILPPHYKFARKVMYRQADLDAWLEQFRVEVT